NKFQVEFAGGALRCGEYITVRKIGDSSQKGSTGSQQTVVEGPLCEDYYKIRELLYSQILLVVEVKRCAIVVCCTNRLVNRQVEIASLT
uniref:Cleavage and polyadenylation specificity factor subunit 2 n=1 Tax=Triticum urartu TaxID=4572 RepID=A0A8R7QJS3_TRIUA